MDKRDKNVSISHALPPPLSYKDHNVEYINL